MAYIVDIYLFIITPDGSQTYSCANSNIHSYTEIENVRKRSNTTQMTSPQTANEFQISLWVMSV